MMLWMLTLAAVAGAPWGQLPTHFEGGQWSEAVRAWESGPPEWQTSAQGQRAACVAYFQSGQLGRALWHCRMAAALAPRNADDRFNLEFLRKRRREAQGDTGFTVALSRREGAWGAAILWMLGAVLTAVALWRRGRWVWAGVGSVAAAGVLTGALMVWLPKEGGFVVALSEAVVRSGPGTGYPALLSVQEGAEMERTAEMGPWWGVRLPGGKRGWVERSALYDGSVPVAVDGHGNG